MSDIIVSNVGEQVQMLAAFVFQVANRHHIFFLKGDQQLSEWYEIL